MNTQPSAAAGLRVRVQQPFFYFVFVIVWTWSFWVAAIFSGQTMETTAGVVLYFVGGLAPLLAGAGLVMLNPDRQARKTYWRRLVDLRLLGWKWGLAAVFLFPLTAGISVLGARLLGYSWPDFARFQELTATLPGFLGYTLFLFIVGPLHEELGWRGYAQDRMQAGMPYWKASLIIGVIWAAWHIPLFVLPGTFQSGFVLGSAGFWFLTLGVVPQSVLIGWVFWRTGGSTLSAVIMHFALNYSGELFSLTVPARGVQLAVTIILAAVVVLAGRGAAARHFHSDSASLTAD